MAWRFGFTDHDRDPDASTAPSFEPESGFAASEVRAGSDLSVDAQDAEGVLTSDRITETDILDGRWDNAAVEVWRVNWADTSQRVLMRRGAVGQIRRGRLAFVAEVAVAGACAGPDGRADVSGELRRRAWAMRAAGSIWRTRPSRAPASSSTCCATGPSPPRGSAGFAAGWFTFGTLDWTSGANAGRRHRGAGA